MFGIENFSLRSRKWPIFDEMSVKAFGIYLYIFLVNKIDLPTGKAELCTSLEILL